MDFSKINMEVIKEAVSDILKLGPTNLIGIDIGLSAVRVAEVLSPKKGSYKLNNFAYRKLPEGCLIEDDILKPTEIVRFITECFKNSGLKNQNVCIGLSGPNTMSKRLQISGGNPSEIEDQVMWESEQYIPFGVDDSTVSYHVIGENEGGGIDVFVAAASNPIVENFHKLIKDANLKLKIVDLDLFALANVYEVSVGNHLEPSENCTLVLDFGAQTTNMIIYKNKSVLFTREISVGGLAITEEIQRQMGLSFEEAEDLKIRGDENGNLPEEIMEIIDISLESFFTEIKKTVNFFLTAASDENVEACYITGGTSLTPGLLEGLENGLGIKVNRINPLEKISYNERAIPEEMLPYIGACGCIAIGLALRTMKK